MRSFSENEKLERLMNGAAAGQGTTNGDLLDTLGYDSVTFIGLIGAVDPTGTVQMKIQQGREAGGGDMADLSGATADLSADDDDKLLLVEIYRPRERYVRPVIVRATADSAIDGVVAILRDPQRMPVVQPTDVGDSALVASPAES